MSTQGDQRYAVVFPGQGSLKAGMLASWLERPDTGAYLARLSEAAGWHPGRLEYLGTKAELEEILPTEIAQPLIVAAGVLAYYELVREYELVHHDGEPGRRSFCPAVVAGHSLGELTAAVAAGVLRPTDAVRLAAIRGQAMAAASALEPTGMCVVVGGDAATVASALGASLIPANYNLDFVDGNPRTGQAVVAGRISDLEHLKAAGSRVVRLSVSGAFHTHFMEPAVEAFREAVAAVSPCPPESTLLTNCHGRVVADGGEFLELLAGQIVNPVYWAACMRTMAGVVDEDDVFATPVEPVTMVVEIDPSGKGVLTGLVRKAMPGIPALAVRTPEDLRRL